MSTVECRRLRSLRAMILRIERKCDCSTVQEVSGAQGMKHCLGYDVGGVSALVVQNSGLQEKDINLSLVLRGGCTRD